jgi:hypothetical protein
MSELKPCPFCKGEYTHLSSCYFSKVVLVRQYDHEFPYTKIKKPTQSELDDAWNNRPYENEIKADAVREAIDYADCLSHDVIDWIKRIKLYANKLKRGEV